MSNEDIELGKYKNSNNKQQTLAKMRPQKALKVGA